MQFRTILFPYKMFYGEENICKQCEISYLPTVLFSIPLNKFTLVLLHVSEVINGNFDPTNDYQR